MIDIFEKRQYPLALSITLPLTSTRVVHYILGEGRRDVRGSANDSIEKGGVDASKRVL